MIFRSNQIKIDINSEISDAEFEMLYVKIDSTWDPLYCDSMW